MTVIVVNTGLNWDSHKWYLEGEIYTKGDAWYQLLCGDKFDGDEDKFLEAVSAETGIKDRKELLDKVKEKGKEIWADTSILCGHHGAWTLRVE